MQQRLMLMLATHRHQSLCQWLQLGQRHQTAIHISPASPSTLYNSSQNQFIDCRETGISKHPLDIALPRKIKECLNSCFIGTGTHQIGASPVTEQKANGIENNRLACPGLTSENVKTIFELHFETINNGKIGNRQVEEHNIRGAKREGRSAAK